MLDAVKLSPNEIAAALVAISFAAGLNVYATLATLGLLARFGVFLLEFFADKVPAFDLVWNALHTFIRIPVAALLAYGATSQLSPEKQMIATLAGGLIALAAHGGKTAIRAAVTPSPEPFSNIGLSMGEDAVAILLTWFATRHPYAAAVVVAILLVLLAIVVRMISKSLRTLFRGAKAQWQRLQLQWEDQQ